MTVRRVFGEPYEKNGITVIPGAMVSGGGGGGGGHDERGQEGEGGGFGMNARPAGAFVIKDGEVMWRPAVDVNRLLMVAGAVAVTSVITWGRLRRQRRRWAGRGTTMMRIRMPRRMARKGMMPAILMRGGMPGVRGGIAGGRGGMPGMRGMIPGMGGQLTTGNKIIGRRMAREFMAGMGMNGKGMSGKGMLRKGGAGRKARRAMEKGMMARLAGGRSG